MNKHTIKSLIAVGLTLMLGDANAKPPAAGVFCQTYPSSQQCTGQQPSCSLCHVAPPQRNAFGAAIEMNLAPGMPRPLSDADFSAALPSALLAADGLDSDGDGVSNRDEILQGTLPADANSKPGSSACQGGDNPQYAVCKYDLRHAYRKALLDFCGASPTYPQLRSFLDLPSDDERRAFLDAEIDRCTGTDFWRGKNGQLWKVAHPKIRPVGSLKAGEDPGGVQFAGQYVGFGHRQPRPFACQERDTRAGIADQGRATRRPMRHADLADPVEIDSVDLIQRRQNLGGFPADIGKDTV